MLEVLIVFDSLFMGNLLIVSGGGGKVVRNDGQKEAIIACYNDVIEKMGAQDRENLRALEGTQENSYIWLIGYWFRCLVAVIETPFHLFWHLVWIIGSRSFYFLILLLAILLDMTSLFVLGCVDMATTRVRKVTTNKHHGGEQMTVSSTEVTCEDDVDLVLKTPAVRGEEERKVATTATTPGRGAALNHSSAATAAVAVVDFGREAPSLAPVLKRSPFPNLHVSRVDGLFICLGRTIAHHEYMFKCYFENVKILLSNLMFNCLNPSNVYSDSFIPLRRPPNPYGSGHVGGGGRDCCEDCIRSCLEACMKTLIEAISSLCEAMSPIGSAIKHPQRFNRSLYFAFTGVWVAHPSRYAGPCCLCCRRCYSDYDERGQGWQREFEETQLTKTKAFFQAEFGALTYEEVLEARMRLILNEWEELKMIEAVEVMERGAGGAKEKKHDDGEKVGEEEGAGLVRGVVGGVWGLTKGAAKLAILPITLPVWATVGTVRFVASAVGGGGNKGEGNEEGRGTKGMEEGTSLKGEDVQYFFDAQENDPPSLKSTSRILKLVREGSSERKLKK